MGNAVGPVALIAAGIYLGYLTLTGRARAFADFLAGGTVSPKAGASSSTGATSSTGTVLSNAPGSSMTGTSAAQTGSITGLLPAGAAGTAAGMSQQQAANAATQTLQNYILAPN